MSGLVSNALVCGVRSLSNASLISMNLIYDHLAPVVQTLDSAIHWINHYPLDNSIGFTSVYPLASDLSGGQRYPSFEQLGPDVLAI